jgi:heme/copper-type cytochrome/quinol oxidase subunit 2
LVFFFSSYTEHEHHLCSGSQATHTDSHFIIFISVVVVAVAIAVAVVVVVVAFGLC